MRVVAVIQARMGSQRLPGKVLMDIAGETMLGRVVRKVREASSVFDEIVVATSRLDGDDAIAAEARRLDVTLVRGPEDDVLARYLIAARDTSADVIVRMTADCPLLEASVISRVVRALGTDVDYASNTHRRSYPRGLDVEAFHRDTLERIGRMATSSSAHEHVTSYIMEEPTLFRVSHVIDDEDNSDLRWTVDTPEDLELVRRLHAPAAPYRELVARVRRDPALMTLNAHVTQKPWSPRAA